MASNLPLGQGFDETNIDNSDPSNQTRLSGLRATQKPPQPSANMSSVDNTVSHQRSWTGQITTAGPLPNYIKSITNRRFKTDKKSTRQVELLGEDKVGRNKLEEVHRSLPTRVKSTFMITFSPDGLRVASTHGDHRIYICDLNTGKLLDTLEGHPKTPWCLAWHPTNRYILASGCLAGEVKVWDLRSKACESWSSNTIITSLSFHPRERILMVATSNLIHFWDWSESEPYATAATSSDKEKVRYVEFDSSGAKLITGISNSPKLSVLSNDSLQTRIIDSYLTQNPVDQVTLGAINSQQNQQTRTHQTTLNPSVSITIPPNIATPISSTLVQAREEATTSRTDNMTQNSEATIYSNNLNMNDSYAIGDGRNNHTINSITEANNEQQIDFSNTSTLTLSRVASLYRHLEALEDSMRRTSFSPFINSHQVSSPTTIETNSNENLPLLPKKINSNSNSEPLSKETSTFFNDIKNISSKIPTKQLNTEDNNKQEISDNNVTPPTQPIIEISTGQYSSIDKTTRPNTAITQSQSEQQTQPQLQTQSQPQITSGSLSMRANSYEPLVVLFDDLLENIQLRPLIIDGRTINSSTVYEQYPIDLASNHLHYLMQLESINQVNQNFIRISKMMSTIRVYRQVVQQSLARKSNQGHYPPNQILTAQSSQIISPRPSSRNMPLMFGPSLSEMESTSLLGNNSSIIDPASGPQRPMDPILAIQFRNSARNIPLVTICKMDLLSARSLCIMRSQKLIEEALALAYAELNKSRMQNNSIREEENIFDNNSFFNLMNKLQKHLTVINRAPLTTSNVQTLIATLKQIIDDLLRIFSTLFFANQEGQRLVNLAHEIAHSLTGRTWSGPLGATLGDIRLDVIHTLCITDLTLHLARQVQLLQMQHLTLIVRVAESRKVANFKISSKDSVLDESKEQKSNANVPYEPKPSTSRQADDADKLAMEKAELELKLSREKLANGKRPVDSSSTPVEACGAKRAKMSDEAEQFHNHHKESEMTDMSMKNSNEKARVARTCTTNNISSSLMTTPTSMSTPTSVASQTQSQYSQALQASQFLWSPTFETLSPERVVLWNGHEQPQLQQNESLVPRMRVAGQPTQSNIHILMRIYRRIHDSTNYSSNSSLSSSTSPLEQQVTDRPLFYNSELTRRRAMSQDNGAILNTSPNGLIGSSVLDVNGSSVGTVDQLLSASPSHAQTQASAGSMAYNRMVENSWQQRPSINGPWHAWATSQNPADAVAATAAAAAAGVLGVADLRINGTAPNNGRITGQNVWWMTPFPVSNSNYRLQCWNFSLSGCLNLCDSQSNMVTQRCRIDNDSSIDISQDGSIVACLVPRNDAYLPNFDLKIFSLASKDLGACYFHLPHGPNAISVSLSPMYGYALVGLASSRFMANEPEDDITIAKVFKLSSGHSVEFVRDIKVKRDGSLLSLNAIRWLPRGIVYNVGPLHHQRYQTRMPRVNLNLW